MSADTIIKKILDDSRQECAAIEADAKARAQEILQSAGARAEEQVKGIADKAEKDAGEANRRRMQIADLDGRKQALAAKRALIDEAFDQAADRLKSLPDDRWEALMLKRIAQGAETGTEQLVARAEEQARFKALLPRANQALREAGKAGDITLADRTAKFAGGFTLVGAYSELNSSYEVMLREARGARGAAEREIAQLLFGGEV